MAQKYQGSCLCGNIHYQIHGELGELSICHCKICQKVNGSAFLVAVSVNPDDFELDDPKHYLASYESSAGVLRFFCHHCASPLYSCLLYTSPSPRDS